MTTLRIAIESGDAQRNVDRLREVLRQLGSQAVATEDDLRLVGRSGSFSTDPFAGVRASVSSFRDELQSLRDVQPFGAGLEPEFGAGLRPTVFSAQDLGLDQTGDAIRQVDARVGELGDEVQRVGDVAAIAFGGARQEAERFGSELERTRSNAQAAAASVTIPSIVGGGAAPAARPGDANAAEDPRIRELFDTLGGQKRRLDEASGALRQYGVEAQKSFGSANTVASQHLRTILALGGAYSGIRLAQDFIGGIRVLDQATIRLAQSTGLGGQALDELRNQVVAVGADVPVVAADLLNLANSARRFGVRDNGGIEEFVRQVATLRTISPGIGGGVGDLGDKVATFLTLTGEGVQDIARLNDVVARLQNTTNATGDEILDLGFVTAREGGEFVKSSTDALALGAALASVGKDSGAARTALTSVFGAVRNAATEGGRAEAAIERLTNLAGPELRAALQSNPVDVFVRTLEGLRSAGADASFELGELGVQGTRQASQILALAANTGELSRVINEARDAAEGGGDAQRSLDQVTSRLTGQTALLSNSFGQIQSRATEYAQGLSGVVRFARDLTVELFDLDAGQQRTSAGAAVLADTLTAVAAAGAGALVVGRLVSAYQAATAAITIADTSVTAFQISGAAATTTVTGLAAAVVRARAAMVAFATSPAGIAIALGAAVAAFVALNRAADDFDATRAISQLDDLSSRLDKLDRAAAGLEQARDIVFRASIAGDADQKLVGLRRRLAELQEAANVVAGELRVAAEPIQQQIRQAVTLADGDGATSREVTERTQRILEAGFRALEAPRLPPDQAKKVLDDFYAALESANVPKGVGDKIRGDLAQALSQVSLPTGTLQALKIDDLVPNVETATGLLENAVGQAFTRARDVATKDAERYRREVAAATRFNPSEFAGASVKLPTPFSDEFRNRVLSEIGGIFGPDVQAQAQASIDLAIRGIDVPGFSSDQNRRFRDSLDAIFAAASGRRVSDEGFSALQKSIEATGTTADDAKASVQGAIDSLRSTGDTEGISKIASTVFQEFRIGSVTATSAQRALNEEIKRTNDEIAGTNPSEPTSRLSDFYKDEAQRIREATRSAQLSIGQLTPESTQTEQQTTVRPTLFGFDAEVESIRIAQDEYRKLIDEKVVTEKLDKTEAQSLVQLSSDYAAAQVAVAQYRESQRQLGQEQEFLGRTSGILGQELRVLGLRARGETGEAFAVLRRQVALTREEAEKDIDLRVLGGATEDDVRRLRAFADAERDVALRAIDVQQALVENRREIDDLAGAATSFGSNATDAILGLKDPLEAVRAILLDLARQFLEPRLTAGFLDVVAGGDKSADKRLLAAEQAGVRDLVKEGPAALPAAAQAEVTAAAGGTSGALAALTSAAQAAAAALSRIFGVQAAGAAPGAALSSLGPPLTPGAAPAVAGGLAGAAALQAGALGGGAGAGPFPVAGPLSFGAGQALPARTGASLIPGFQAGVSFPGFAPQALQPAQGAVQQGLEPLAEAGATAAAGLADVAQAGATAATSGLAPIAQAAQVAGGGFGAAQAASLELAGALSAAGTAALDFAGKVGLSGTAATTSAVTSTATTATTGALGAVFPLASGGVTATAVAGPSVSFVPFEVGGRVDVAPRAAAGSVHVVPLAVGGVPGPGSDQVRARSGAGSGSPVVVALASGGAVSAQIGTRSGPVSAQVVALAHGGTVGGDVSGSIGGGIAPPIGGGIGSGVAVLTLGGSPADAVSTPDRHRIAALAFGGLPGLASALSQRGPTPTVADLSGSVVGRPTFALIGEGADREAVMPLDGSGGVRGIGQGGQRVSLPLARDASGKLGVRVEAGFGEVARQLALGGIPGRDGLPATSGARARDALVGVAPDGARSITNATDNRSVRSIVYNSTVNVNGGGQSQLDAGMKYSLRQFRADVLAQRVR